MSATADKELEALLEAQERALLLPSVRGSRKALEALLAPDFREFGSGGRVWTRDEIVMALETEALGPAPHPTADCFRVVRVGEGAALVTYRSEHKGRQVLRSSLWVQCAGRWVLLFHQGTPASEV